MNRQPHILLTNDDGINAPGIRSLWEALEARFSDISIIAPSAERSGTGVSITWDRPMLIQSVEWDDKKTPAWSIEGTPADCIKIGSRVILKSPPDFIVSGINAGSNAGRNVLHSGTVGAVIEGVLRGIPGVAISCEDGESPNFDVAKKYIPLIIHYLIEHPLPSGCFLNVNFPRVAKESVKGFKLTRQGKGRWAENPYLHIETESGPSYWLGGKPEELIEDEDCDIALLRQGYMTAVPIHVHELTDRHELKKREVNFESYFNEKVNVL